MLLKQYYCDIDIAHLINYNDGELAHNLKQNPAEVVPLVRRWSARNSCMLT